VNCFLFNFFSCCCRLIWQATRRFRAHVKYLFWLTYWLINTETKTWRVELQSFSPMNSCVWPTWYCRGVACHIVEVSVTLGYVLPANLINGCATNVFVKRKKNYNGNSNSDNACTFTELFHNPNADICSFTSKLNQFIVSVIYKLLSYVIVHKRQFLSYDQWPLSRKYCDSDWWLFTKVNV